jgi:Concanavalin A-like lectin/glucanases superfamily
MDYQNNGNGAGVGSAFNQFQGATNNYVNATQDFLDSNSLVAKVAFLLLVLFVFVLLFRLGMMVLGYFLTTSDNPTLVDGMVDAKQLIVIPQDPSNPNAITIKRSVNATDGIEFTWSVWVFIDDLTYNSGQYRCVFYKGNDFASDPSKGSTEEQQGLNFPNNAPGVYIAPNTNNLIIFMNTFNVINEQVTVEDIPINKWFNLLIRCQNTTLDIYMNGLIVKSYELHGVPKQNYGDVYVGANGGFSGNISDLKYYNYALGTSEINRLVNKGPDTNLKGSLINSLKQKNTNYLSLRWYFYGNSA